MTKSEELARPERLLAMLILGVASSDYESLLEIKSTIDNIALTHKITMPDQKVENELRLLVEDGLLDAFLYNHKDQQFKLIESDADLNDLDALYFLINKAGRVAMNSDEVSVAFDALHFWE